MKRFSAVVIATFAIGCSSTKAPLLSTVNDGGSSSDGGAGAACTNPPACLHSFALSGSSFTLPYYSTFPIDQPNPSITRIVVFNQGLDRDADNDFSTMVKAAQMANAESSTLVFTPHFEALVNTDGTACSGHTDTPLSTDLLWTCDTWSDGLAAANAASATSYGALDALLAAAIATFPNARVVVAGFSAGGQLTQRYVAASRVQPSAGGAPFRYVVGDPSSYLYFDNRRPANASNCTPAGCPDGFPPFNTADGACPNYNDWKYGTDALVGAAALLTPTQLEQAYVSRNVTYLLGTLDNAATTAAHYSELDVTCPAEAEGPFRYQRGLAYYAYATTLLDAGTSALTPVAGCAHSGSCVFQSAAGLAAVFGE